MSVKTVSILSGVFDSYESRNSVASAAVRPKNVIRTCTSAKSPATGSSLCDASAYSCTSARLDSSSNVTG